MWPRSNCCPKRRTRKNGINASSIPGTHRANRNVRTHSIKTCTLMDRRSNRPCRERAWLNDSEMPSTRRNFSCGDHLRFRWPLDTVQFVGELGGILRIDFREELGWGIRALEKFGFFWRADDQPKRLLIGVVENLAQLVRSDKNGSECRDSQRLSTDAHATGALENKVELLLTDVFVQGVGAFWRKAPEAGGKVFGAGTLKKISVRNFHQVGGTPEEIVWRDQAETCKGFIGEEIRRERDK